MLSYVRILIYPTWSITEKAAQQKDPGTIVSWRSRNTNIEDKTEFEYKQVNELFTSYHQLAVTSGDEVYKLNILTIPRTWLYVTFTWSKAWGLKFYQNGVLVAETGRARKIVTSATNPTDGLFIIGNKFLSSEVKSAENFQLQDLTVWPRIVSQAQIREQVETGRYWVKLSVFKCLKNIDKFLFGSSAVCFVFGFAGVVFFFYKVIIETFQNTGFIFGKYFYSIFGRRENVFHLFALHCVKRCCCVWTSPFVCTHKTHVTGEFASWHTRGGLGSFLHKL